MKKKIVLLKSIHNQRVMILYLLSVTCPDFILCYSSQKCSKITLFLGVCLCLVGWLVWFGLVFSSGDIQMMFLVSVCKCKCRCISHSMVIW